MKPRSVNEADDDDDNDDEESMEWQQQGSSKIDAFIVSYRLPKLTHPHIAGSKLVVVRKKKKQKPLPKKPHSLIILSSFAYVCMYLLCTLTTDLPNYN